MTHGTARRTALCGHHIPEQRKSQRRSLSIALHVVWVLPFGVMPPIHAQTQNFWSFLKPGRLVTRCEESSAAAARATQRLQDLDQHIERLKDTDPPSKAIEELHTLLKSDCFLLAAEIERVPAPDTSASLKEWWREGGSDWLASFLELPRLGLIEALTPHVIVPPDVRKTLDLESHRDHPLASLLCALGDTACGAQTRGWKLRADAHFNAHKALAAVERSEMHDERPPASVNATSQECAETASTGKPGQRYQAWRACIEKHRPTRVALPLGEFKAPVAGWFVISGRRGHYSFCDTTRAYDLATGTAFMADSCSGLVLESDGSVDFAATDKARVQRVAAGEVPVENLREAVWIMLFRGEAKQVQLRLEAYPLPAGLIPQVTVPKEHEHEVLSITGMWANTGQTSLTWRWLPPAGDAFVGELTWPASYDAAEDHAVSLLAIAEEALVEGCPEQRVPEPSTFNGRKVQRLNGVETDSIKELEEAFGKAFDPWKMLPACRLAER